MSKIKWELVEKLFKEKYPTGDINYNILKNHRYEIKVSFIKGHKLYTYKVRSFKEFLNKCKLTDKRIIYKNEYENYINRIKDLERDIKNEYWIDEFGFTDNDKNYYSKEELKNLSVELKQLKNEISNSIIV